MTTNRSSLTPMQAQWLRFRKQFPKDEYILAFRMGDFFEFFDDDAREVSRILDITCTTRQDRPLAGFPYAQGHENLEKIARTGKSVVVVDQVESPEAAKERGAKVVSRDVVRIITPGTVLDEGSLDRESNNYVASLLSLPVKKNPSLALIAIAFCDISTGDFFTTSFTDETTRYPVFSAEMTKHAPSEIIHPPELVDAPILTALRKLLPGVTIRSRPREEFDEDRARETILDHFNVTNLESFGIEGNAPCTRVAGGLISFLQEYQRKVLSNIGTMYHYKPTGFMQLDHNTLKNLEILRNIADGSTRGTLYDVFSGTCTIMGARMVKRMLLSPLMDVERINERLDLVESLVGNVLLMEDLRDALTGICDLERLISRINYSPTINARHLLQLADSLARIPRILEILNQVDVPLARRFKNHVFDFSSLVDELRFTLKDNPPPRVTEGGMIREGINPELDELRSIKENSNAWLARFQDEMRRVHGISTIKVKQNKVFGYFIEVSKSNIDKVPADWERKQTLVNAERYITPELKKMEEKIITAEERIFEIEHSIFLELKRKIIARTHEIQETARTLAELDAMTTMASVASSRGYRRPVLNTGDAIVIKQGRHPTIELIVGMDKFIPNDTHVDPATNVLSIITGPNMSGKSTYLRQICLIIILAQVGSFIPAESATIGIVDKIFSRVGAMDDITRARSTFLVEMNETAYILNHATKKSLVILDELGRGTSTFDGVSLAWAVAEYLHARNVKTLFATHYHQLADLEEFLPRVKNFNVMVKENEETRELIFLHKVVEGSCDKSYGIQVARLAGLPNVVLRRAEEILERLLDEDPLTTTKIQAISKNGLPVRRRGRKKQNYYQLSLPMPGTQGTSGSRGTGEQIIAELEKVNLEQITPLDAFEILKRIKDKYGSTRR